MAQVITAGEVVTVHAGGGTLDGLAITGLSDGGYAVAWVESIDLPGPTGFMWYTIAARLDVNDNFIDLDAISSGSFRNLNLDSGGTGGSEATVSATLNGGFVVGYWDNVDSGVIARFSNAGFQGVDDLPAGTDSTTQGTPSVSGLTAGGYVASYAADAPGAPATYDAYATTYFSSLGSAMLPGPTTRTSVAEVGNGYVLAYSDFGYVKARLVGTDLLTSPIDITVNQTTSAQTRIQTRTSVAELSNGNFAVTWAGGAGDKVLVRVFEPDGDAVTDEIWVDGDTSSDRPVSVVALKGGGFAVLWVGTSAAGIQAFDNAGNKVGDPFYDFGGDDHGVITDMTALESGELLVSYQGGTYGFAQVQKFTVGPLTVGSPPTNITGTLKWTEGKGSTVGTLHATDADNTSGFTWALLDDAGGRFKIDASTGKITVKNAILLDYEQHKNHSITVKVSDGDGHSFTKVLSAKGTDVAMEDLVLSAKADKVWGGAKVDMFAGGKGDDTLKGGGGKDVLDGGKGKDTADYSDKTKAVEVALDTSHSVTVKVGGKAEDSIKNFENIIGGAKADTLTGDGASNTFHGGLGKDILDGKGGKDFFVFDAPLGSKHADTIEGFKAKDDTIVLDHAIFTALGVGPLSADAFAKSNAGDAIDNTDRILFSTKSGKLFYDADGSGDGAKVLFATLADAPKLTAADFDVV